MDAPCVAPSRVTQTICAVLVKWHHYIVLTMIFKLVSFSHLFVIMCCAIMCTDCIMIKVTQFQHLYICDRYFVRNLFALIHVCIQASLVRQRKYGPAFGYGLLGHGISRCDIWCYWSIAVTGLFLPARRYASAGNSDCTCLSVCPSVRLSVTRRYCVKMKKASGMISSPSGSPKTLVLWRQISSPNSKGFPPNGGLKEG